MWRESRSPVFFDNREISKLSGVTCLPIIVKRRCLFRHLKIDMREDSWRHVGQVNGSYLTVMFGRLGGGEDCRASMVNYYRHGLYRETFLAVLQNMVSRFREESRIRKALTRDAIT